MRPGNVTLKVEDVLYEMRPSTKTAILDILKPCTIIVHGDQNDNPEKEKPKPEDLPDIKPDLETDPPKPKKGRMFRRNVS